MKKTKKPGLQSGYFVLSTVLLCKKDKVLVKNLCVLLSGRLEKRWVVSSTATVGTVIMAYTGRIPETKRFQHTLVIAPSGSENSGDLIYPIRSNQLLLALNNLHLVTSTELDSKKPNQKDKNKSLDPANNEHVSLETSAYIEPNSNNKLAAKRQRLAEHKEKFLGKANSVNVVFLGTPGSGKTTAITSVSTSKTITTDVTARDSLELVKAKTTVALDYGEVTLANRNLKLIGNPGQTRFDHMWHMSCEHADVFVILINCTSDDIYNDLDQYWGTVKKYYSSQPILVGLTHYDLFDSFKYQKEKIQSVIGDEKTLHVSILDPRSNDSVASFLSNVWELPN